MRHRIEAWFCSLWWHEPPRAAAWLLAPLTWIYRAAAALARRRSALPASLPVPVIVVGNVVVGGVGKTPIVIALVQALRAAGRTPGVISRGHGRGGPAGRSGDPAVVVVHPGSTANEVGDEPLLIRRRTGAPVFVAGRRVAAARALCAAHPVVDVIVSDDGLQHHALPRVAEVIVFDDRGTGNGLLLPAGPLREALPRVLPRAAFVAYSGGAASTPLPGWHVPRHAARVWPLDAWRDGCAPGLARPLAALRGRRLLALAGLGAPGQFFALLEAAGLDIEPLACPDHAAYPKAPWPAGTPAVVTTEKDAVKLIALPPPAGTEVWVLPLDCELPPALVQELLALLPPRSGKTASEPAGRRHAAKSAGAPPARQP